MDSMSRSSMLAGEAPGDAGQRTRGRGRDSLFLMAQLMLPGDRRPRDVRVRNLSEGGLMVELDLTVPDGTPVALALRGIGEVGGQVAWCAEGRIGVAFDQPIDPLRARKPVGKGATTPTYAKPQLG